LQIHQSGNNLWSLLLRLLNVNQVLRKKTLSYLKIS